MVDASVPDNRRLTLTVKKKVIISDAIELRDGRKENLKNDMNKELENALILMVRYNKLTVDQLKRFLEKCDPNYYSPVTKKSAFSYSVEKKKLIFAQVLLDKMSGKNENNREHFQRDLKTFSEQLDFNSEIFKTACKDYYGKTTYDHRVDSQKFVSDIAEALIVGKTIPPKGYILKRDKVTLQRNRANLTVQENDHNLKRKQFLNHFSTLLYYKWKAEYTSLQEVQAMWVSYTHMTHDHQKSITIFTAVHPYQKDFSERKQQEVSNFFRLLSPSNFNKFCNDLTKNCPSLKGYDQTRYNRVREKFKDDKKYIFHIFCRFGDRLSFVFLINQYGTDYSDMHAEEILCDEAEAYLSNLSIKDPIFYIYGKKRPCISCYSRMEILKINNFNRRHGKFWSHGVRLNVGKQTHRKADIVTNTLKLLVKSNVHITVANNIHHEDWDTDSEDEKAIENPDIGDEHVNESSLSIYCEGN